jgi:hypothetical protein
VAWKINYASRSFLPINDNSDRFHAIRRLTLKTSMALVISSVLFRRLRVLHTARNRRIWERSCSEMLVSSRLQTDRPISMSTNQSELATAALETLHGARALPPAEAMTRLRDFMDSIWTILPPTARLADASGALKTLVNQLESEGVATDDTWEHAIETMLSFANESA